MIENASKKEPALQCKSGFKRFLFCHAFLGEATDEGPESLEALTAMDPWGFPTRPRRRFIALSAYVFPMLLDFAVSL